MCKSVRVSQIKKILQNEPIGFDTAENGPSKVWATKQIPTPPGSNKHLWRQDRVQELRGLLLEDHVRHEVLGLRHRYLGDL